MLPTVMMPERPQPSRKIVRKAPQPKEESAFSLQGKRAIIVEDEGMTQIQLRRILLSEGMEVVGMAANGQEAVELVLGKRPDVVLMDIRMPVMDGLEAARRILEQYHVCIVMLTAFSDDEYQQAALTIGACGYVVKPVTADILIPQLRAFFQKFS